jgi:hypothetical protein
MVDLPIPQVPFSPTQAPQSRAGGGVFQDTPRLNLASGLEALGQGVEDIAIDAAKSEGKRDASQLEIGPDGQLKSIEENHWILGKSGDAYLHAFEVQARAVTGGQVDRDISEMRNSTIGNPQASWAKTCSPWRWSRARKTTSTWLN